MSGDWFSLEGRRALVTGATRGIGRAIVQQFAARGARVIISSRKADACEAAATSISADYGEGTAVAFAANLSSAEEVAALGDFAEEKLEGVDVLVCNAGVSFHIGLSETVTPEVFDRTLQANVHNTFLLARRLLPGMARRKDGSVIIVSSIGGLRSSPLLGPYSVSKAALHQLMRNLAGEFGPSGVRVNCLCPGTIETDMTRTLLNDPVTSAMLRNETMLRRFGAADEMAGAAVFLASAASGFVTGHVLVADGGATAQ